MKIEIPKGDNFVLILAGLNISQRDFISILCQSSIQQLLVHLENFTQWVWEKGDALCWSPVFDRFDIILHQYISKYIEQPNVLNNSGDWLEYRLVEAILKVSIIIVENCTSKNYYNSLDHLVDLLEDTSPNIVYLASRLISIYFSRNKKSNVPRDTQEMMDKLHILAQDPLPERTYSGPIECSLSVPAVFDYYLKSQTYSVDPKGYVVIGTKNGHGDAIKISVSEISEENIPNLLFKYKAHRFELIRKLMVFKAASSPQLQKTLVNIRFASLISLLLVNKQVFLQFLNHNPSFIFELSSFISHFREIDMITMIVATELLSSLIYDGIQYKALASILGFSSPEGLFITVLKSYLTHNCNEPLSKIVCRKVEADDATDLKDSRGMVMTLTFPPNKDNVNGSTAGEVWCYYYANEPEMTEMANDIQAREERMNILLQLLIAYLSIVSYHGGAGALVSSPVLELLVGFLKNRDPISIPVIIYVVQILESLLEYSQSVCQILRNDLDLFSVFTSRIHYDFQKLNAQDMALNKPNYPVEQAKELAKNLNEKTCVQSRIFFDWWFHIGEKNARTFLFKTILKDLDVFVRSIIDFQESLDIFSREIGVLPIVKWVLNHPKKLDLGIYASSLTLISDTLNEDPVALPSLIESGLINDLLDSITPENIKCEDVLSILPTLVCDLFLHPAGREAIKARNYYPILLLVGIITDGEFVLFDRFGEVSSCIGSSVEEIVRNDPEGKCTTVIADALFLMLGEMIERSHATNPTDRSTENKDENCCFERGKYLFGLNEMVDGHHFYADRLANLGKFLLRYLRKSPPVKNFILQGGFTYIDKLIHSPLLPPLFMHIFPQHPMVTFLRSLVCSSGPHVLDLICELAEELSLNADLNVVFFSTLCLLYSVCSFHSRETDVYGRAEKALASGHPFVDDAGALPQHAHRALGLALASSARLNNLMAKFVNCSHCKTRSLLLVNVKSSIHSHPDSVPIGEDKGQEMTENDLFWVTQCGFAYSRPNPDMADPGTSAQEYEIWRITLCKFKAFLSLMARSIHTKWTLDSVTPEIFGHAVVINSTAVKILEAALTDEKFKFDGPLQLSKYVAEAVDLLHAIHFEEGTPHPLQIYLFTAEDGYTLLARCLNRLSQEIRGEELEEGLYEYAVCSLGIAANYLERVSDWRTLTRETQSHDVSLLTIDAKCLVRSIFGQLDALELQSWGDNFGAPECFEAWDSYERLYHQDPARLGSMERPSPQPTFYAAHVQLQQLDFQSPSGQSYQTELIPTGTGPDKSASEAWKKIHAAEPPPRLVCKDFTQRPGSEGAREYAHYSRFAQNVLGRGPPVTEVLGARISDGSSCPTERYRKKNGGELVKRLLEFPHGPRSLPWLVDILTRLAGMSTGQGGPGKGGSCLSYAIRLLLKDLARLKRRALPVFDTGYNARLYCVFFTLAHLLHRFTEALPACEAIDGDFKDLLLYFILRPLESRVEALRSGKPTPTAPPNYFLYALISLSTSTQGSGSGARDGGGERLPSVTMCLDILAAFPCSQPNLVLKCLETIDARLDDHVDEVGDGQSDGPKSARQFNSYRPKVPHVPLPTTEGVATGEGLKIRSALHLLYGLHAVARPRGLLLLLTSITLKALRFKRCKYASVFVRDVTFWLINSVTSACSSGSDDLYALNHDSLAFIIENAVYQYPLVATVQCSIGDDGSLENCLYKVLIDRYFPLFIRSKPSVDAAHHFISMMGVVALRVGGGVLSPSIERLAQTMGESGELSSPMVIFVISELCEKLSVTGSTPNSALVLLKALYHIYSGLDLSSIDHAIGRGVEPVDYFCACNALLRAIAGLTSPRCMAYRGSEGGGSGTGEGGEYPYQAEILNVTFTASPMCSDSASSVLSDGQTISHSYSYSYSESGLSEASSVDGETVRLPHEASSEGSSGSALSSNSEGSDSEMEQVPRIRLAGELDGDGYHEGSEVESQGEESEAVAPSEGGWDAGLLGPARLMHPSEAAVCEFLASGGFDSCGQTEQNRLRIQTDTHELIVNWDGSPDFLIPPSNPGLLQLRQASPGPALERPRRDVSPTLPAGAAAEAPAEDLGLAAIARCLGLELDRFLECAGMSPHVLAELPSHIRHEVILQQLGTLNLSGVDRAQSLPALPDEMRAALTGGVGAAYLDALPLAYRIQITRQLFSGGSGDGVSISSIENITLGVILNGNDSEEGSGRCRGTALSFSEERDNSAVEIFTNLMGRGEAMEKIRLEMESAISAPGEAPPAGLSFPRDAEFVFLDHPPHFVQTIQFVCACLRLRRQVNKKVVHKIFYNLTVNSRETRSCLLGRLLQLIHSEIRAEGANTGQGGAVFAFRLLQHLRSLQIAIPAVTLYLLGSDELAASAEDDPASGKRRREGEGVKEREGGRVNEYSTPLEGLCTCIASPLFHSSLPHSAQIISLLHFCLFGESRLRGGKVLEVGLIDPPQAIDRGEVTSTPSAGLKIFRIFADRKWSSLWTITHYGPNQQTYKSIESLRNASQQRAQVAAICSLALHDRVSAEDAGQMIKAAASSDLSNFADANVIHRLFLLFMDVSLVDSTAGRVLEPFFYCLTQPLSASFATAALQAEDSPQAPGSVATLLAIAYFGISFRLVASEYGCSGFRQLDDVLSSTALHLSEKRLEDRAEASKSEYNLNYWVPGCHASVVEFCEAHRGVLNELIRGTPSLLHGGLEALVRLAPFTLSFENKRLYFRQKLKDARGSAGSDNGSLPFTLFPGAATPNDNSTEEGGEFAGESGEFAGESGEFAGESGEFAGGDLHDMFGLTLSSRHEPIRLNVRREHVFMDSYHQLRNRTAEEMKGKLSVTFIGEEGVDAGGLTREWFSILAREMFNPNYALFTREGIKSEFNHPNPLSGINPDHLNFFRFIGRVIGKAIYDSHHLDAYFCRSFYKHMLRRKIVMADAESVDPEFYGNLKKITCHRLEDLGLELYFSAEIDEFGKVKVVDLIPNGRNILVTEESKMEYVRLMCQHKVSSGIQEQLEAFLEGFYQLIPPKLIGIFDDKELELLISGVPTIDLEDMIANVDYVNYSETSPQIIWLWGVLADLGQDMLASFLQFVTGTSRVPIGGFRFLMGMRGPQRMSIHRVLEADRLPTAHTCFNQLDLPCYPDIDTLKLKLLMALTQGKEGFSFV